MVMLCMQGWAGLEILSNLCLKLNVYAAASSILPMKMP